MIEVMVVGEGQTEETFVEKVLGPALWDRGIALKPLLIRTSGGSRGGALSRDRVLRYFRNVLRQRPDTYVTTLFDLYKLPAKFPGVADAETVSDPIQRAVAVEKALDAAVVEISGCRPERFLAHIQPHEFESLLFSDVDRLIAHQSAWQRQVADLRAARAAASSPEHVNDGEETHPSARLGKLQPRYEKVLDGPLIAGAIGLQRIRADCAHFGAWLRRLEGLAPL